MENYIENCGETPVGFIEKEIGNDPNFVFSPDKSFGQKSMWDFEGNTVTVNSYQECIHYVKGGWRNDIDHIFFASDSVENSSVFLFILLVPIFFILNKTIRSKIQNFFNNYKFSSKLFISLIPYLIVSPIYLNIINKIRLRGVYFTIFSKEANIKYISLSLSFLFFYLIAKYINETFNLRSLSLAISYFLISFYIFDSIFLYFSKEKSFEFTFLLVNFIWFVLVFIKNRDYRILAALMGSYFSMQYFNSINYQYLSNKVSYQIKNYDVVKQWEPIAKSIADQNLFFAININLIEGYGFLISYIQVVISKFLFFNYSFEFININANILLFLTLLLIFDLEISHTNKFLLFSAFCLVILDDGWLRFLIIDSLMLEGIVSFLFASFVVNIKKIDFERKNSYSPNIFLFFLSCLIFSKQFIGLLTVLILIWLCLKTKRFTILLSALGLSLIKYLYQNILPISKSNIQYVDGLDLRDLISDFLLFRDIELKNIRVIFEKLIEYKPMAYILFLFLLLFLFNTFYKSQNNDILNFALIFGNILLILLLYISWWKQIETDSSYRYIMNTIHLIFISAFIELDKLQKRLVS